MSHRLVLDSDITTWYYDVLDTFVLQDMDIQHDFKSDLLDFLIAGVPFDEALQMTSDLYGVEESEELC